jgi:hypothetical protein
VTSLDRHRERSGWSEELYIPSYQQLAWRCSAREPTAAGGKGREGGGGEEEKKCRNAGCFMFEVIVGGVAWKVLLPTEKKYKKNCTRNVVQRGGSERERERGGGGGGRSNT